MPLFALAIAAYLAGSLIALSGGPGADGVLLFAAAAVLAVAGLVRAWRAVGLILAFAAGSIAGTAARQADRRCLARALAQGRVVATLQTAAAPGSYVPARIQGCGAGASLSVVSGEAEPGARVVAVGEAQRSRRGVHLAQAVIVPERGPSLLHRWRNASARAIDARFGTDAPLARALLVADGRAIPADVRERYSSAGLAHLLSISGLHVGIISGGVEMLLLVAGVSRRRAGRATAVIVASYVAMLGFPAPAVRAGAMLILLQVSRALQRPTSPWSVLAVGACQAVADPRTALGIGYQLSLTGVASLIAAGRLMRRLPRVPGPEPVRSIVAGFVGSTVATAATAPLVAWHFGRVSLVGPLTNIAAAPLLGIAQPMMFAGLVTAPVPGVSSLFADAAHPLLIALDRIAEWGSSLPGATVMIIPTPLVAGVGCVAAVCLIAACVSRDPWRPLAAGTAALLLLVVGPPALPGRGVTELHMLDVGQGDAIALRTPRGRWVLFDAGRAWRGGDAGRSTIVPYISRRGGARALDAFVLSHPHMDHVGGAATVVRALRPRAFYDPGYVSGGDAYRAALSAAAAERTTRWHRVWPGDSLIVDGVVISFLAPDSAWAASLRDPNDASTVALVRAGDVRILLVGDAERAQEEWLLTHVPELLRADILKVGHHGSSTSSSWDFLDAVAPSVALISVGSRNMYGHPHGETLRALAAQGAHILRTDRLGTVILRLDGRRIVVDAADDRWELPVRSWPEEPQW